MTILERRAELRATVDQLERRVRRSLDLRAKARENPLRTGLLVAGIIFLGVGGPGRLMRGLRGAVRGSAAADPMAGLPAGLRAVVEAAARGLGPDAEAARRTLAQEILAWRNAPTSRRQARELARALAEGPPGPGRAFWRVAEVAAVAASGLLVRALVARLLDGDGPTSPPGDGTPPQGWSRSG